MKLSWSHKLFLKINKTLGTRPWLDKIMYFFGQWLIFIMALTNAFLFFIFLQKSQMVVFSLFIGITFLLAYGISYTIALLWKHPRPIRELPHIEELIIPIETWKSFPSDHTIAVTLMAIFSWYMTNSLVVALPMALAALCVMVARVYCGVHYPRDIIGGIVVAFFSVGVVVVGFIFLVFFALGNPSIMN